MNRDKTKERKLLKDDVGTNCKFAPARGIKILLVTVNDCTFGAKTPEIKKLLKLRKIQEKAAIEIRTGGEQVPPLKKNVANSEKPDE